MFEAILISATGVWFAIFVLLALVALIISIENDSLLLGTAAIIVITGIAQFVFGIAVLAAILTNPLASMFFVVFYIALGAAYAGFWRLPNFVSSRSKEIKEAFIYYSKNHKDRSVSHDEFLNSQEYKKFTVSNNKDVVASWVLLWPAGVIWELSHKPIRWVWNQVYYGLGESFEKLNRKAASKVLNNKK